jgi:UDP-N-acetylmuramoyl-L-alanyl-D-glutamate--2,6-diaminopimelate ligase
MRLDTLLTGVAVRACSGDLDVDVTDVTLDSSAVRAGALFCAVRGARADGHDFAAQAVERGAVAVLGERLVPVDVPQIVVPETRPAMAEVAAALHDHPSHHVTVVGVTGTNGKTTTTHLLRAIFDAAGQSAEVIGSLGTGRTTPEAPELQRDLARLRADGRRAVAMEVSSAALVAHRVDAIEFAAAVFTNLGHDHIGEVHASMDDYFAAKASLFTDAHTHRGIVNTGDEWGARLAAQATIDITPYAPSDAHDVHLERAGTTFTWRGRTIRIALPGAFNVANAVAAATTAAALGIDVHAIVDGLASVTGVPGRFEWIDAGQPFGVAVDYAHTPEALEQSLLAARQLPGTHRVIVVFGCGGDRDPSKRAPMGAAAGRLADVAVITSDNPRREDPRTIIDGIVAGVGDGADVVIEPNRETAINIALEAAGPADVVVIAGKGHENGQQIGDEVVPFDDREVAERLLRSAAS